MYYAWIPFGNNNKYKEVFFSEQKNWNRVIMLTQDETGWKEVVYFAARSLDGQLYLEPIPPIAWKTENGNEHVGGERALKGECILRMVNTLNNKSFFISIRRYRREWLAFGKYVLPSRPVTISKTEPAEILDESGVISKNHGVLTRVSANSAKYRDHSANGTYLNGRALAPQSEVSLTVGDILAFPSGLKIVYLGNFIAVNRTAGTHKPYRLQPWKMPEGYTRRDEDHDAPNVVLEFPRPPRMLLKCEAEDTEIEAPIPKDESPTQPWYLQVGPSMTMILPMMAAALVAGSNMTTGLVMIGTASALAVMWGLMNRRYRKRQSIETETRRVQRYRKYISETEQMLSRMNQQEMTRLHETFPDVAQCAYMPEKVSNHLWSRMPTHPDFLNIRLGTGTVALPCKIEVPKERLTLIDDDLRSEPDRLKTTYSVMHNAPVTLPLRRESVIGILGGARAVTFAQAMIVQIAALHSYHDVHIAVLTEEGSANQWLWVRWLPHVFTSEDRELRMVAYTPKDIHEVALHLDEICSIRRSGADEQKDNSDEDEAELPLPHYVVFCTNNRILEDEPVMRQIITNRLGVTLVMLGESMTQLPKECRVVLNMQDAGEEGFVHYSEGDSTEVEFEYPDMESMQNFAWKIAPIRTKDLAQNAAIPTLVSFLDTYNVRRVEDLDVWRMWSENHTYDGLRSTIGYKAGSQPFVLDISDKYHGPHGLIAGTTGSGKSVMLETYILSLALNYSPKQVQFILIDYKGGGMADAFRNLPHVAGIIDNLQGDQEIDRALASLNGEIQRREQLFKAVEVNNIEDYTRVFGEEPGWEMPHLIIIVDEFAELKSERPEFMAELVSASRVGRSLGIHLILATQKPSGSVSDEIWSNARFHLCLRVQTPGDSKDMLKRPDAAYIKGMGRCFIQIGNDEIFEQVQTSYSGLEYRPDEPRPEEMPQLLDAVCRVIKADKQPVQESSQEEDAGDEDLHSQQELFRLKVVEKQKKVTQMKAVLDRVLQVAGEHGMAQGRRMWLPVLPKVIELSELEFFCRAVRTQEAAPNPVGDMLIPVGLADDVAHQRYMPYSVNLTRMRNLQVVGLAGSGKTTLVQTMIYSLCSLYDPEHVQIYVLSLSTQTMHLVRTFPQVGDVLFRDDAVEVRRLVNNMIREMERRGELFEKAYTDSFMEYNRTCANNGWKPVPAVVVFIDRFKDLMDMFENSEEYKEAVFRLIHEGSAKGIHFVVTSMAKNEVPVRHHPFFGGIGIQLPDRGAYSECISGKVTIEMKLPAALPGRGFCDLDDTVMEFQVARAGGMPVHKGKDFASLAAAERYALNTDLPEPELSPDESERSNRLLEYARQLDAQWQGERPVPVARIPQNPTWEDLFAWDGYEQSKQQPFRIPIGFNRQEATLACLDITDTPGWLLYGFRKSGVTNALKMAARVMLDRGADVHVFADNSWKRFAREADIRLYTTPEEIDDYSAYFQTNIVDPRFDLRYEAVDKGLSAARQQAAQFKPLCIIVDDADAFCKMCENPAHKDTLKTLNLFPNTIANVIAQTPYYNILVLVGISKAYSMTTLPAMVRTMAGQARAVALGGKLNDFDPCDVKTALPSKLRGAVLPRGYGYLFNNSAVQSILVPLAEKDE